MHSTLLPRSLGVVPQALPLHFALPRTGTRFLAVQGTFDQGLSRSLEILDALEPETCEVGLRSFVGETGSVVYAPFAVRSNWILDTTRGTPLCRKAEPEGLFLLALAERPPWQLSFIPALCPSCG